jgi:DNA-directed RNA polymerase I and III subunit RPAC2
VSVNTVLQKGLTDLMDVCDVVEEKFTAARDEHFGNQMQR